MSAWAAEALPQAREPAAADSAATPASAQGPQAGAAAPGDDAIIHQALHRCRGLGPARRASVDVALLRRLLAIEREEGVPESLRGVTLAKACIESGFQAAVRGDCAGGSCRAVGMIQLWPWAERFGVDRRDPEASVRFLLQRVQVGIAHGRMRALCGRAGHAPKDAYRLAWLRINRGPLQRGRQRCAGVPKEWSRLRLWQRAIAREALAAAAPAEPRLPGGAGTPPPPRRP